MSDSPNGPSNETTNGRILIAVRDVGQENRGQGTLIGDVGRAERIVEALVEAGVEPEAVSALRATEIPLRVTYRWEVEIVEREDGRSRGRPREQRPAGEGGSAMLKQALGVLREVAPDAPFQLRLDRVIWVGLWAVSLLVLGLSVITSLSRGSAREFVIEVPPASYEGELQPFGDEPAPENPSPTVGGVFRIPECMARGVNECRCADFATREEAQTFFETYPPRPGHIIDPDGNGIVCEWLPVSTPPGR